MSQASNYMANALIRAELGLTSGGIADFGKDLWLALCTVTPTKADTGSTLTELLYAEYARKQLTKGDAAWTEIAGGDSGDFTNAVRYEFVQPVLATDETSQSWAIVDAATAGNVLRFGLYTGAGSINVRETTLPVVQIGTLPIRYA